MKISKRSGARHLALQALYQWYFTAASAEVIETQFLDDLGDASKKIDCAYFSELLNGVVQHVQVLDAHIGPALDRPIDDLNPVELVAIRIACYELMYRPEIPYKVVINEALEATKIFGATEGHKYVNAVLDRLGKDLRADEIKAHKG